jgi:beta-galactosidase GanA
MRLQTWILSTVALAGLAHGAQPGAGSPIPHLERRGDRTQLIVDGKPFLALAGEVYNNSATSLEFMAPLWPRLKAMHLNTVLAPISWGMLERAEGKFDYTLVDGLIRDARAHDLHLVFLWFGSWKNSWSSYAPDWVKRDVQRFPRVQLRNGVATERLSPFADANCAADARAFAALMRRIREVDGEAHTVIMLQVQNEVGMIPDARDYSPAANAAYNGPAPKELIDYLVRHKDTLHPKLRTQWQGAGSATSGSWEAVFGRGPETEDLFTAWRYARYIGKVAEAGKAQYGLPMFTNAALIRSGYAPGQYNSGGPLSHSMDVWKAAGPGLDFLAPDIYFEFSKWCAEYDRADNPLFIPEAAGGERGAAYAVYAVGQHAALGYSPFGIDWFGRPNDGDARLSRAYDILAQLAPLLHEHQPRGRVAGVLLNDRPQRVQLGDYTLDVFPTRPWRNAPDRPEYPEEPPVQTPHGVFIATGADEFYMAGAGLSVRFSLNTPGGSLAGLATVEEGQFVDGRWRPGRTLAGDDTDQGNGVSLGGGSGPGILRVTLYRYH